MALSVTGPFKDFEEVVPQEGKALDAMLALHRDTRSPQLIDARAGAYEEMHEADLVVLGAGSVGQGVLDSLARMQPRRVRIIDYSVVKAASVLTHPLGPGDIGRDKARLAGERFRQVSPSTQVLVYSGAVQRLPRAAMLGADVIFVFTDNHAAELDASRRAVELGIPLLAASVHGASLTAQVRSFSNRRGDDPHFCCFYSEMDWVHLDRGTRFSCEGSGGGGGQAAPEASQVPTVSPAVLCATAAQLCVCEWLRSTLLASSGDGVEPQGSELQFCGYTMELVRTAVGRRPDCRGDHSTLSVRCLRSPLADASPRELLQRGGWDGGDVRKVSLEVEGFEFAGLALCECSPHRAADRFFGTGRPLGHCERGHSLVPHPLYVWREVPGAALAGRLDTPLDQFGAVTAASAVVRCPDGSSLVHAPIDEGDLA